MDKAATVAKPLVSQIAELISAISSFAWPLIFLAAVFLLRDRISEIVSIAIRRLDQATDIEIGSLKIKGATVLQSGEVLRAERDDFKVISATAQDVKERFDSYSRTRNLMLVHTIKPSDPPDFVDNFRVFSVSVFLHPHRNFGHVNDVKQVFYFFGDKWGPGKNGSKYVVTNGNDQFGMTAQMYGSCLCVAEIEFQDGERIKVERYLDVEMAPVFGVALSKARE